MDVDSVHTCFTANVHDKFSEAAHKHWSNNKKKLS